MSYSAAMPDRRLTGFHQTGRRRHNGYQPGNIPEPDLFRPSGLGKSWQDKTVQEGFFRQLPRILRLEGLEEGANKGEGIDSFERWVYIHGTPYEYAIGQANSKGCIRMNNSDVVELFEYVAVGDEVNILVGERKSNDGI